MSDSLAIEWSSERLVLLQGRAAGNHVSAKQAAILEWPEGINPLDAPARAAEWLKGELSSHGFTAKQAVVSLPRETVVVRHMELPPIPDDELPEMVRLQAATKVTMSADQYLLDYIPLPPRNAETRDALMATVPTDVTKAITQVLLPAGIEITSIGVTSFHVGEIVAQQQDAKTRAANQLHLAVSIAGSRVEVALLRGRCALATSSTRVDADGDRFHKAINAEVNRVRLSAQELHGGLPVSHVWVTPGDPRGEGVCEFLKNKLRCEGTCFDPLGGSGSIAAEDRGAFAATAGHLVAQGGSHTEVVNFLDPRKPAKKADRRKIQLALAGAGLAAVLGVGGFMLYNRISNIREQTAELEAMNESTATRLEEGDAKKVVAKSNFVGLWADKNVNWLDEQVRLNKLIPHNGRLLVERYQFSPGKKDRPGFVRIFGLAASRDEYGDLADNLEAQDYKPAPPVDRQANDYDEYEHSFSMDVDLPEAGTNDSQNEKAE